MAGFRYFCSTLTEQGQQVCGWRSRELRWVEAVGARKGETHKEDKLATSEKNLDTAIAKKSILEE